MISKFLYQSKGLRIKSQLNPHGSVKYCQANDNPADYVCSPIRLNPFLADMRYWPDKDRHLRVNLSARVKDEDCQAQETATTVRESTPLTPLASD